MRLNWHHPFSTKKIAGTHCTTYSSIFRNDNAIDSNPIVKKFAEFSEDTTSQLSGDGFQFPKTTENAIPIYNSVYLGSSVTKWHKGLARIGIPVYLMFNMNFTGLVGAGLIAAAYNVNLN